MAERMRDLLDGSTPGPWAGVHGQDRRRDRGAVRTGAIETEFASGKRVICEEVNGADKAFILYARNHFGRLAELLDLLAERLEGASPSAAAAPRPAAPAPAAEAPPVDVGEHFSGDGFEIDLSSLEDVDMEEIAETLKELERRGSGG
ncbi:hypothetical protein JCM17961_48440 [Endothiovibrio diazotrophicus]